MIANKKPSCDTCNTETIDIYFLDTGQYLPNPF